MCSVSFVIDFLLHHFLESKHTFIAITNKNQDLVQILDSATLLRCYLLKEGAVVSLFAKALGPESDIEKYIRAAFVVPKSLLEPLFCTLLKASGTSDCVLLHGLRENLWFLLLFYHQSDDTDIHTLPLHVARMQCCLKGLHTNLPLQ